MSLETEIQNLTAAINRWCDVMSSDEGGPPVKIQFNNDAPTAAMQDKIEAHAADVLKAVTKQKVAAKAEPLVQTATPAELAKGYGGSPAQVTATAETEFLTFEDAKRAFLGIAQKYGAVEGTAKSREVLSRYGAAKLKDVAPELYGDFIELCGAVVEGGAA